MSRSKDTYDSQNARLLQAVARDVVKRSNPDNLIWHAELGWTTVSKVRKYEKIERQLSKMFPEAEVSFANWNDDKEGVVTISYKISSRYRTVSVAYDDGTWRIDGETIHKITDLKPLVHNKIRDILNTNISKAQKRIINAKEELAYFNGIK